MGWNEPIITLSCDRCQDSNGDPQEFELTALVQRSWDNRHGDATALRKGWHKDGLMWVCPECWEQDEETR